MKERLVLVEQELMWGPVSDWELANGIDYAKKKSKVDLDGDLLRILFDTVLDRRKENIVLPLLTARVVQKGIPFKNKTEKPKYEAYKCAIMKIFADRSARSAAAQAKKRKTAELTLRTGKKKKREHPEDLRKKYKGQLILL